MALANKRQEKREFLMKFYTEKKIFMEIFGEDEFSKLNEELGGDKEKLYNYLTRVNEAALPALDLKRADILGGK